MEARLNNIQPLSMPSKLFSLCSFLKIFKKGAGCLIFFLKKRKLSYGAKFKKKKVVRATRTMTSLAAASGNPITIPFPAVDCVSLFLSSLAPHNHQLLGSMTSVYSPINCYWFYIKEKRKKKGMCTHKWLWCMQWRNLRPCFDTGAVQPKMVKKIGQHFESNTRIVMFYCFVIFEIRFAPALLLLDEFEWCKRDSSK